MVVCPLTRLRIGSVLLSLAAIHLWTAAAVGADPLSTVRLGVPERADDPRLLRFTEGIIGALAEHSTFRFEVLVEPDPLGALRAGRIDLAGPVHRPRGPLSDDGDIAFSESILQYPARVHIASSEAVPESLMRSPGPFALPAGSAAIRYLERTRPDVEWIRAADNRHALELVANGEARSTILPDYLDPATILRPALASAVVRGPILNGFSFQFAFAVSADAEERLFALDTALDHLEQIQVTPAIRGLVMRDGSDFGRLDHTPESSPFLTPYWITGVLFVITLAAFPLVARTSYRRGRAAATGPDEPSTGEPGNDELTESPPGETPPPAGTTDPAPASPPATAAAEAIDRDQWNALKEAHERLQARHRDQAEFLIATARSLRTSLGSITGFADLLSRESLDTEAWRQVDIIARRAGFLTELTDQLLDLAGIDAGQHIRHEDPVALFDLLDEVVDEIISDPEQTPPDIEYRIAPETPEAVLGDSERLQRILTNLVSGAAQLAPSGSIRIDVSPTPKESEIIDADPDLLTFGVSYRTDNPGRPHTGLKSAFADGRRRPDSCEIYGLPFVLAARLAEAIGGRIEFRRIDESGATIELQVKGRPTEAGSGERVGGLPPWSFETDIANGFLRESLRSMAASLGAEIIRDDTAGHAAAEVRIRVEDGLATGESDSIGDGFAAPLRWTALRELREDSTGTLDRPLRRGSLAQILRDLASPRETVSKNPDSPDEPEPGSENSGAPLRVLLAEDHPVNSRVALLMLDQLGHAATAVENGNEVIARLREETFDIVLMDIQMPVMDGIEATRAIRRGDAGDHNRDIPVVAMTAFAMSEDRQRCISAGMTGHISKPVRLNNLVDAFSGITPRS